MAAPTSALTFNDLILDTAVFLGTASYGAAGDEAAQIPTDAHDLAEVKRIVNSGIRMFFNDAPATGWRFSRPVASITIFGAVNAAAGTTVSGGAYDSGNDETILTATGSSFYPGLEYRTLTTTTSGDFQVKRYISATSIAVFGDASAVAAETFAYDPDGHFTLPAEFGGEYTGNITYAGDTNQGVSVKWVDESLIRQWKENTDDSTGDPYWAAVRPMEDANARGARRWELVMYPEPDEVMVVQFPFQLHFDSLVEVADTPPTPYNHDETLRAACLAVAERDQEDAASGHHNAYYEKCLMNSKKIDARSGPRRLGYFGNPGSHTGSIIDHFRNNLYDRPTVEFNQ